MPWQPVKERLEVKAGMNDLASGLGIQDLDDILQDSELLIYIKVLNFLMISV